MNKVIVILVATVVVAGIVLSSKDLAENGQDSVQETVTKTAEKIEQNAGTATQEAARETPAAQQDNAEAQEESDLLPAELVVAPVVYGDENAPVTMTEYASYSCSHCATFHNDRLPVLMEKYIESGKLRLEMYSFVRNQQDLRATMLIQCLDDNKQRQQFTKVLFKSQSKWAYSADFIDNLRSIASVGGVSQETFDACVNNTETENAVLKSRRYFDTVIEVPSTPYFVAEGKTIKGVRPLEDYVELVEALLPQ